MAQFDTLVAIAAPMKERDVNTDLIVPGRFLRRRREDGLGECLFRDLRFHEDGTEKPDFVLNRPAFREARILVANENFACGSSREFAVYALYDHGIRCVIAPSFGDIFHNNCFKTGLLPVVLPEAVVAELRAQAAEGAGKPFRVDLPSQTVTGPDGMPRPFSIDPFRKKLLLAGMDEIAFTLSHEAKIVAFEAASSR